MKRPEISPAAACRDAAEFLEEALLLPPGKMKSEVDEVERRVVKLRDLLIDLLRAESEETSRWREPLDRINVALSLVASVEYPATGIHMKYMEDAHEILRELEERSLRSL